MRVRVRLCLGVPAGLRWQAAYGRSRAADVNAKWLQLQLPRAYRILEGKRPSRSGCDAVRPGGDAETAQRVVSVPSWISRGRSR